MANSRSPRKPNKKRLSIDSILKECQDLQSPSNTTMTKYMRDQIGKLSSAYDQINSTDLNPIKYEASRAYQNGKVRLNAYLEQKNRKKLSLNQEKLEVLLRGTTIKDPSTKFTFNNLCNTDLSYLVAQNKRKFGKAFKIPSSSAQVSPYNSELPSISNSPKISPKATNLNLTSMINTMIDKKLGLLPRRKTIYKKKKTRKIVIEKEKSIKADKIRTKSEECDRDLKTRPTNLTEKAEEQYLNPEFMLYHFNVGNNVKIQKLVAQKLAKDRRASISELALLQNMTPTTLN